MGDRREEMPGRGRSLASPAFAGDDGSADPTLRAAIASDDDGGLVAKLRSSRLLAAVVAVLGERDESTGADKSSDMVIVSMVNAAGERGLLAFTGLDSLAAWDPSARPVPVTGADAARAALDDGATALVIDVLGPVRRAIAGEALRRLAGDDTRADDAGAGLPPGD